jgi:outer membrane lipase/esterase
MRLLSKVLFSAVLVLSSLAASASAYSSLVIFGDSLSDSGNNSLVPGIGANPGQVITGDSYIPSQTYSAAPFGTYSNGPVWATQFAGMLGLGLTPSLIGGNNYAFGGAKTGIGSDTPSLIDQTSMFLGNNGGVADSNALYVVAGGGNNVRATMDTLMTTSPSAFASVIGAAATQYALDIASIVDRLQSAGAKNIIVWNAPNLGVVPAVTSIEPYAPGISGLASLVSQSFNSMLGMRLSGEVGVKTFDLYGIAAQAAADGFTNTTNACGAAINAANCTDINKAMFWDGIHPTTAAHGLIARGMLVTAVPEPETWALMLAGLGFIGYRTRRRAAQVSAA